ncbi:MAG: RagB/SusD family nutrient uptake outer membrane protein [Candidatus Azobacteroides sp.]|nr:RagB/SusD family nutrient uptake outer membrane protein [Candidatus Azobacteroides sp.]
MKKIVYILVAACFLFSCEDFLDTTNKTGKDTGNFPRTKEDASQLLTGVYAILSRAEPLQSSFLTSELMSDDRFGGGGPSDRSCKAIDQFKKSSDDMFNQGWRATYMGVFRANFLISTLDEINWENGEDRKKIEGEVHFLRAHFYFDLSRMFGEVPLVLEPEPVNIPKAPAAETYALIASDLKRAIECLPDIPYQNMNLSADLGHVTKWAAEALMARVFLFYTGYYKQETLPLREGGEITKAQVIEWVVDCIENSGHGLVEDFRNIWAYSYVQDYPYTANNNLSWVGDGSKETVFAIKYSAIASDWDSPHQKSNQYCLYSGLRGQPLSNRRTFPFGIGWGMGTVNPKIWDEWDDNDIRKKGSMFNAEDKEEIQSYTRGGDNLMDETLYWQKKYITTNIWKDDTKTSVQNMSYDFYPMTDTDYMRDNIQDLILIRFSDVLLMAAELGAPQAQSYLDAVRSRVGLNSVPVTLENIKKERRFELAFEGIRYYDLLRWHDWDVLTNNQTDIAVYDKRVPGKKTVTFRPETGGFLSIPQTQIDLSNGVLVQNPGWKGAEHNLD